MSSRAHLTALTTAFVIVLLGAAGAGAAGTPSPSGGAGLGGLAPTGTTSPKIPAPPSRHSRGHWLRGATITEYWPAPEAWFTGALVPAPGLTGAHRIDWLYSAQGVSMQGEGLGLDGLMYHIAALGTAGWLTVGGRATSPFNGWAGGPPFWRDGGFWRNRRGGVTFPLATGGWSGGVGKRYVPLSGVTFAAGPSLPLQFYRSLAVDPSVIPLGSQVYIPSYRHDGNGGWFLAQDTGGAISGQHVDVFRSPPATASNPGQYLTGQRIYVIKPRHS
jgi:3D (Asp-Asp-Asp) domain-containing protein